MPPAFLYRWAEGRSPTQDVIGYIRRRQTESVFGVARVGRRCPRRPGDWAMSSLHDRWARFPSHHQRMATMLMTLQTSGFFEAKMPVNTGFSQGFVRPLVH
jgi:hypothetical protein